MSADIYSQKYVHILSFTVVVFFVHRYENAQNYLNVLIDEKAME